MQDAFLARFGRLEKNNQSSSDFRLGDSKTHNTDQEVNVEGKHQRNKSNGTKNTITISDDIGFSGMRTMN